MKEKLQKRLRNLGGNKRNKKKELKKRESVWKQRLPKLLCFWKNKNKLSQLDQLKMKEYARKKNMLNYYRNKNTKKRESRQRNWKLNVQLLIKLRVSEKNKRKQKNKNKLSFSKKIKSNFKLRQKQHQQLKMKMNKLKKLFLQKRAYHLANSRKRN